MEYEGISPAETQAKKLSIESVPCMFELYALLRGGNFVMKAQGSVLPIRLASRSSLAAAARSDSLERQLFHARNVTAVSSFS